MLTYICQRSAAVLESTILMRTMLNTAQAHNFKPMAGSRHNIPVAEPATVCSIGGRDHVLLSRGAKKLLAIPNGESNWVPADKVARLLTQKASGRQQGLPGMLADAQLSPEQMAVCNFDVRLFRGANWDDFVDKNRDSVAPVSLFSHMTANRFYSTVCTTPACVSRMRVKGADAAKLKHLFSIEVLAKHMPGFIVYDSKHASRFHTFGWGHKTWKALGWKDGWSVSRGALYGTPAHLHVKSSARQSWQTALTHSQIWISMGGSKSAIDDSESGGDAGAARENDEYRYILDPIASRRPSPLRARMSTSPLSDAAAAAEVAVAAVRDADDALRGRAEDPGEECIDADICDVDDVVVADKETQLRRTNVLASANMLRHAGAAFVFVSNECKQAVLAHANAAHVSGITSHGQLITRHTGFDARKLSAVERLTNSFASSARVNTGNEDEGVVGYRVAGISGAWVSSCDSFLDSLGHASWSQLDCEIPCVWAGSAHPGAPNVEAPPTSLPAATAVGTVRCNAPLILVDGGGNICGVISHETGQPMRFSPSSAEPLDAIAAGIGSPLIR